MLDTGYWMLDTGGGMMEGWNYEWKGMGKRV